MTPRQEVDTFIDKFTPDIARHARAAVKKMRARFPQANVLVYDNYNALAIGFAPGERTSEAIFSIAVFPKWVSLFFLQGAGLRDAKKLLKGSGNHARHIVLKDIGLLDDDDIVALMQAALKSAKVPLDPKAKGKLIIKSVSERQRPRRP